MRSIFTPAVAARGKLGSQAVGKDPSAVDFMLNLLWKRKVFPDGQTFFVNPTTGGPSVEAPNDRADGGLLGEEMGSGKTLQGIVCIVQDMARIRIHHDHPKYRLAPLKVACQ